MSRMIPTLALALTTLLTTAPVAFAQLPMGAARGTPMVRFGFGGGVSVPTSDAGEVLRTGVNGQAYLLINTGVVPLRFNLGYQRFDFEDSSLPSADGQSSILSGVGGLTVGLLRLGPLQPYVTAGIGAFNVEHDVSGVAGGSTSQMRFGIDGGAGLTLRIGRLDAFIEGRVQNVYTEAGVIDTKTIRAVPVTFGILF